MLDTCINTLPDQPIAIAYDSRIIAGGYRHRVAAFRVAILSHFSEWIKGNPDTTLLTQ